MKSSGLNHLYYLIEDFSVQKQNWGQVGYTKNYEIINFFNNQVHISKKKIV